MKSDLMHQLRKIAVYRILLVVICFVFAILAFISPLWPGRPIESYLGGLLLVTGIIEILDSFKRIDRSSRKSAIGSGAFSILMCIVLMGADDYRGNALIVLVMAVFILDAVRYFLKFLRGYREKSFYWIDLTASFGNILLMLVLYLTEENAQAWALSIVMSFRLAGIGINLLSARTGVLESVDEDVLASMDLSGNPYLKQLAEKIKLEEEQSAPYDRKMIIIFIALLFFIHLGRMGLDRSFFGILSPVVATVGDIVVAIIITYLFIAPVRVALLKLFRKRGQRLWKRIIQTGDKKRRKLSLWNLAAAWLTYRIRAEIRLRKVGYSLQIALRTGLKFGLPWSAILVAIVPVFGMSWYFDTENWAAGVWDQWAAARTDTWRVAITRNEGKGFDASAFRLHPQDLSDTADFSFVVIGDPGEGDASQLVLKDQLMEVSNHPEVKFVVISTDVVYPSGALKDYEKKFWLPFKGIAKPVYAIPGNHDWYDALDGFIATFYEPDVAKRAMFERTKADHKLTSTTKVRIDDMVAQSAILRNEYKVSTGTQTAPYFQVSTDKFVLITVETGVLRQIDSLQLKWLQNVLEASRGKFVMVLLGHPFYAFGEYLGKLNPDFESIHRLLRKYKVPLVMAGDTHDLEYYLEPSDGEATSDMHHFVNGGGGAFLSIGAAMADTGKMPVKEYAFYPAHDPLVKKISANTGWLKYPLWLWTDRLKGWPFAPELLSAMFDYNVSPFFQSFMEIKVEASRNKVVLIPYSNRGRIKWSDMMSTRGSRPGGASQDDYAEWTIPMQ